MPFHSLGLRREEQDLPSLYTEALQREPKRLEAVLRPMGLVSAFRDAELGTGAGVISPFWFFSQVNV